MTPEELEAAVLVGNAERVMALLAGASEPERLACGARMLRLRKDHGDWPYNAAKPGANETTFLALLGTGTAAQIQKGRRMWRHPVAGTVLRLRPRELLDELVPWMLDRLGWRFVRALVREGAIARPTSDAYIYGMLDYAIDAPALVADDPELLEHEVWRLFEVEGTGDHSLADHDKYTPDEKTWSRTLLDLAPVRLDRERLLDASLAALERDFPAFRAGWYSRFHEALSPTPAERVARVDAYLRLLRSPIPPTVTLAVGALTEVQRAGELDGARLIEHIEPALAARAAGTARQGLPLVDGAVRREPALSGAAARAASAALAHPSADVQTAAVALLESVLLPEDEEARALVAARRRDVAASVLPRLDALLAGRPGSTADAVSAAPPPPATATASPGPSRRAASDPWDALVPIAPVASLADLVELLAGVLEREGPPEDLELALDGVLRFTAPRTAEFGRLTKAIRVRSERLLAARRNQGIATWFAALIRSWVDGTPPADELPRSETLAGYLARRVAEVANVASGDRPATLVALPSYAGGWIEPGELVRGWLPARTCPPLLSRTCRSTSRKRCSGSCPSAAMPPSPRPRSCGARWGRRSATPSAARVSSARRHPCGRRRRVAGRPPRTTSRSPESIPVSGRTRRSRAGTRSASRRDAGGARSCAWWTARRPVSRGTTCRRTCCGAPPPSRRSMARRDR